MRLCATSRTLRRTWAVELRPQQGGPVMACPHCPPGSGPLQLGLAAVRPAVVAHLAGHARRDALPEYLRTCQCHERGCQWHPRHRGCAGPIALVLTCERSGRLWRLADVCTACAGVTAHSAVVPETTFSAPDRSSGSPDRERERQRARGVKAAIRVREMLSYLAAALPSALSPSARLLAVQCALRATTSGQLWVPVGLLRSMRIHQDLHPWEELEQAGWLIRLPVDARPTASGAIPARLLDAAVLAQAPGRLERAHAADGALRLTSCRVLRSLPAIDQLVGLALATHLSSGCMNGVIEAERLGHVCALTPGALVSALDRLVAAQAADCWSYDPVSEDITWTLGYVLASQYSRVVTV